MLTGVILAGGETGVAKALRHMDEGTFIELQVQEMQMLCQEIIVVTNEPRLLLPVVPRWIRILTDFIPGHAEISGMHAAFTLAKYNDLWVTASENPTVSSASVAKLLHEYKQFVSYQAAIPVMEGRSFPFHGIYSQTCLEAITKLITAGENRISELLHHIAWTGLDEHFFMMQQVSLDLVAGVPQRYNRHSS